MSYYEDDFYGDNIYYVSNDGWATEEEIKNLQNVALHYTPWDQIQAHTKTTERSQRIGIAYGMEWAAPMWSELHHLADFFDRRIFAPAVRQKINEIPCDRCKNSSIRFCRRYPPEVARTRSEALYWMCKFHNQASIDAGNGTVECEVDPEGYGYVSGHDDYGRDFAYGGGQKQGGGGQKRGRKRQQPPQDDTTTGWYYDEEGWASQKKKEEPPSMSHNTKDFVEKEIKAGHLVKIGNQWCAGTDVSEAAGVKYCTRPMTAGEAAGGYPNMPRSRPLRTITSPDESTRPLPSKVQPSPFRPDSSSMPRMAIAWGEEILDKPKHLHSGDIPIVHPKSREGKQRSLVYEPKHGELVRFENRLTVA